MELLEGSEVSEKRAMIRNFLTSKGYVMNAPTPNQEAAKPATKPAEAAAIPAFLDRKDAKKEAVQDEAEVRQSGAPRAN